MEPGHGPAARHCRAGRVGRRRGSGGPVRPRPWHADRPAGHRPRRRAAGATRRRDAATDDAHAAGTHRPVRPHRPRRGRRGMDRRNRPGRPVRPGRAGRELAQRRCDRLYPRRRARLASPPLRASRQQRRRRRARDPRRRSGPRRRRPRAGPVLGRPRRRRRRRGDRAGDAAVPGPRAVRRGPVLPPSPAPRRSCTPGGNGPTPSPTRSPPWPTCCGCRRFPSSPSRCAAGPSSWSRPPASATRAPVPS